ncbi:MAG: epimerase [Xanthomonadales bacterium]|nr:epimerase [Xanthomonadales bacterium]
MTLNRRSLIRLGAASAAALAALPLIGQSGRPAAVGRASRPLKILILGGTGFTGPHQVRYALARGHQITLFNRGRRPQDWPAEVEELTGDRETGDLEALRGREWDVCIDNPTSVPHWVRDVADVLEGKVGQYIFISTLSAYAGNATPGQDEDAPRATYTGEDVMRETRASLIADMSLYGPLKAECEREAERRFPGIATLVRPGLIVGPGDETDRFTYWPVRLARGGDVLAPGDGSDPVMYIDARDLAEWTIRLAEQRSFGAFNAIGPDYPLSMAAMLYGIRATGNAGARLHWAATDWLEANGVRPWADLPVWIPGRGDTAGFHTRSIARSLAAGLSFRPLAQTAVDTLEWFRSQPAERQAQLRAGLSPQRETELLALLAAGPGAAAS